MQYWQGFVGVVAILALAVLFSTNRRAIRLRIVIAALALQAALAALVLYLPAGRAALAAMSDGVQALINFSGAGISMVFGPLANEVGFSFALNVLPIIIFFSALMSVLYHIGVMQPIVTWGGGALHFLLGTGRVESLTATANVFVGQTEAPLVVRPYLPHVTRPQLFAIMTTGMASVSGSVLAAYAQMGIDINYLLAASFMSAPGGLLMAKIIMPDDKPAPRAPASLEAAGDGPRDGVVEAPADGEHYEQAKQSNVIMAAASGAQDGLLLAASIGAMLIAFVSLIALVNGGLGALGNLAGVENLTLQGLLGYVFAPVMWLLNIPWSEAQQAGGVFGEKLILNEFVAFMHLGEMGDTLSPRTMAITTFALCGFANLSSIGILLAALNTLAPTRAPEMARYGFHVVAAGSLANLMSAALASFFITG
ncbi:MAG: NupC/NupG family nucleoside CNT transporter [Hyphomonadaceae bacterium JAD_PAG50586_4]|nr:MAG: NupC/NupG family nucleoside CNT transporter [Hyphomonadaceae bacterium JAD_PAG50586_4]